MKFFKWLFQRKEVPKVRIHPDRCMHSHWLPETHENGWRSSCRDCGIKAQGSCQG